jgi:hypothetical protein
MKRKLEEFVGEKASALLKEDPYCHWQTKRSVTNDKRLGELIVHHEFPGRGFELRCDKEDRITTIFICTEKYDPSAGCPFEVPFTWGREQVIGKFGAPTTSGTKVAWDRWTTDAFTFRFAYREDGGGLSEVTLMRNDRVP